MNVDPKSAAPKASLFFLVGIAILLISACLMPPWQGRFFNQDTSTGQWHDGGTFGLNRQFAPLFNPPQAFSNSIPGKVRYPWQPITAHEQIQIDFVAWAFVVSIGLAAIGLIARLAAAVESPGRPGPIPQIAFALAVSQIVSMILISIYAVVVFVASDDRVVWILPFVCGTIGCLVGFWRATRTPAHLAP